MSEYWIEESARKRALKFKEDYERHFEKKLKTDEKDSKGDRGLFRAGTFAG